MSVNLLPLYPSQKFTIHDLPTPILVEIFSFLPINGLMTIPFICKKWKKIVDDPYLWEIVDLKTLFPSLTIIDEVVWANFVDLTHSKLEIQNTPPLDKRQITRKLKKIFSSPLIDEEKGVTLLTMPTGLDLKKISEIANKPKKGNATNLCISPQDFQLIEKACQPIKKTFRLIITNNIFKDSKKMSRSDHQQLVESTGGQLPNALAIITLNIMTYIISRKSIPTCLYGDEAQNSDFSTRCCESINQKEIQVGGYTPYSGLIIELVSEMRCLSFLGVAAQYIV